MPPVLSEQVLHRLMAGDAEVIAAVVEGLRATDDPTILVAAVLFADADPAASLARATAIADTTRDRQLVAIAAAYVDGRLDLVDALARDHLVDHPDSVLVAWIAGASRRPHLNP